MGSERTPSGTVIDGTAKPTTIIRVPDPVVAAEQFTPDERRALAPYFTNLETPVFALTNLPEVVKGALFARYSRSAKSVRRLFLDEFLDTVSHGVAPESVGVERAERLYARVFGAYGDDSVAQLGGAHIACEGVSNVLTKILERGRLMAYLEQSTRYIPFTDRPGNRWKYLIPDELDGRAMRDRYVSTLDDAFETYARWFEPTQGYYRRRYPKAEGDSDAVYRASIRAKALDALRGLLPAATRSNVGIFGSGQAFEQLLLRMRAHPLAEARDCADRMLHELRKLIPAFLTRVDRVDRGVRWSRYLADTRRDTAAIAGRLLDRVEPEPRPEVTLTDFDPEGEVKVIAAALYESSRLPDDQLLEIARRMGPDDRAVVLRAYVGDRANRRHRPGRAFERTSYCFDLLSDYGAFRDLQRHRLLTIEWQELSADHGCAEPAAIEEVGAAGRLAAGDEPDPRAIRRPQGGILDAGPVRVGDGLPDPLPHADERAGGDARDRAANRAAGSSVVSPSVPADAPADRRAGRPSGNCRRDDLRRSLDGGARATECRAGERTTNGRRILSPRRARPRVLPRTGSQRHGSSALLDQ